MLPQKILQNIYLKISIYLPLNWLSNVVRRQTLKYRHTGLKKTLKQGTVAGKTISGKPGQRWKKYITDIYWNDGSNKLNCRRDLGRDVLKRMCQWKTNG